jgi:O-acetyl-ADP-ribose deacetylase (regulator of RNase III)
MIRYTKGNLLNAKTDALVNTVNTVGVMGKGIALQFKNAFPHNYKVYKKACAEGALDVGKLLFVKEETLERSSWIINFPTKKHWKGNSKYEYIELGLAELVRTIGGYPIRSIALPPLGCGNGGLDWTIVRPMIEKFLASLSIDIIVFEPNEAIKEQLQKENISAEGKLTPARAMLLYLMFQYESKGEPVSLFTANKLAYFLQRKGENLKLKFEAHHYGPYAVQLNHVMQYLNGTYLKGLEQNMAKPFDPLELNYEKLPELKSYVEKNLDPTQRRRLAEVIDLIKGFESTFALELLATVDFVKGENKHESVDKVLHKIGDWSNRKTKLFKSEYIKIASERLANHSSEMFIH